ncbi:MAG: YfhO family protein [Alphaproteobacteria bacterium]|nr:YfhO family protein [Alphaproteobacteria bacterium]
MSLLDGAGEPKIPFEAGLTLWKAENGLPARTWSGREFRCAVLALIGFYGLALAAWLATGTVVPWDSKNHFYAMFRFLGEALRQGEFPFWNPYHFAGHPAIADPQSLIFTPSLMLFALIAPKASMPLFDAVILAHLLVGGICVIGLARRWHWHPAGAVLSAIIFMLGGAASSRLQHTGIIISYSFFPAALWCLDLMLERCSYRFALAFGLCASLMALGRDQVAFLLCTVLVGYAVDAAFRSGTPFASLRARLGVLATGVVVILALLSVPALLTLQFLADSNRPGFPFGVAAVGSLAPVNLITLFVGNFFGSLDHLYDYWGPDYDTMPRVDWTDRAIDYLFIGALPFLLIAWHGFAAGRLFARKALFLMILLLTSLVYALGRYTPLFAIAFDSLPGISLYRRPADATFLINIALALSAGFLLDRYIREGVPRLYQTRPKWLAFSLTSSTLAVIVCLIANAIAFSLREGRLIMSMTALGCAGALAVLGLFILVRPQNESRRAFAASLFVLVSGIEILWHNAASPLNAEPLESYSIYSVMKPSYAAGIAALCRDIDAMQQNGQRPRVEILGMKGPWQNVSMILKLEDTLGYNPLRIDDYERAVGPGQDAEDFALRHYPGTFRGYNSRLARLLGIEYLVLNRPLTELPRDIPRPKAEEFYTSDDLYIYKLGKIAPRAYFAADIQSADNEEVLDEQALPDFNPDNHQALIDESNIGDLHYGPYAPATNAEPVRTASLGDAQGLVSRRPQPIGHDAEHPAATAIVHYDYNSVSIDVDAPKAGIVVLHDLYYPGWEVRVDGQRAALLRANILFRGVEVPPGHHHIEFSFHPLSLANLKAAVSSALHRGEE